MIIPISTLQRLPAIAPKESVMKKEYKIGDTVQVLYNDVWREGVVEDDLSDQYYVAVTPTNGTFVFKRQTDRIKEV